MLLDKQLLLKLEKGYDRLDRALQALVSLSAGEKSIRLADLQGRLVQNKERLRSDLVFTIAIVGQIKAGKSTLADVLFFGGKDILPTGPTPTTSALTEINFRPSSSDVAIVHYYSAADWARIESLAAKFERGGVEEEELVAKGCAEVVERVRASGLDIRPMLGAVREVSFSELASHIGPASVTAVLIHHVEVYSSEPLLEGFRVVDTPGLNDTVFSREKVTQDSLNTADCVLFLSKASQFLDATDIITLQSLGARGVRNAVVLASMFDQLQGDHIALLREFDNRLKRKTALQAKVLPVSALLAKLQAKVRLGLELSEDEQWYLERLGTADLQARSHIDELRRFLAQHVAEKRDSVAEGLQEKREALVRDLENFIRTRIDRLESTIEWLQGDETQIQDDVEKLNETKRVLRLKVLAPQADQIWAIFRDAVMEFRRHLGVCISDALSGAAALQGKYKNKKDHRRLFDGKREALENYLRERAQLLQLAGDLDVSRLKYRLSAAMLKEQVPRIVEGICETLAGELAQSLYEHFSTVVEHSYGPKVAEEINEPQYQTIAETINGVWLNVDDSECDMILGAWRNIQRSWDTAGAPALATSDFQRLLEDFFRKIFEPAFEQERKHALLPREEKEGKIAEFRHQIGELNEILTIIPK
jgi:hypothetical protein